MYKIPGMKSGHSLYENHDRNNDDDEDYDRGNNNDGVRDHDNDYDEDMKSRSLLVFLVGQKDRPPDLTSERCPITKVYLACQPKH